MPQVIQANELTLSQVEDQFNLRQVLDDPTVFREWQDNLPELSDSEMQSLLPSRLKNTYCFYEPQRAQRAQRVNER